MDSELWLDQCELCGKSIETDRYAHDASRRLCTLCQIEWDDLRIESIADAMPKAEDWPEVTWPIREAGDDDGCYRWTESDRRWAMEDY